MDLVVKKTFRQAFLLASIVMASLLVGVGLLGSEPVLAAQLQDRQLQLSDSRPGKISEYKMSMTLQTAASMGSIRILFCGDFALLYYPCTPPAGFDASNATILNQTNISGFSIDPSSTANVLVLTRAPAPVSPGPISITLGNVTNQNYAASSFIRYHTYATSDASGAATDEGAAAYSINDDFSVSTEVPPYLTICVGIQINSSDCSDVQGDYLQLGNFSTKKAAMGQSQFVVSTNADNGYTVRVQGQTMTSGNNTIPALSNSTPSAPGTSQFGINLRANTNPSGGTDPAGPGGGVATVGYGQPNLFRYNSGDVVASSASVEDYRKYTVSYLVNINGSQPAGVYGSSFSYIGLGNF